MFGTESGCCMRQCCGPARGFILHIEDNYQQVISIFLSTQWWASSAVEPLLARTASRYRMAYILPLWFFSFSLFLFFIRRLISEVSERISWTHIHLWLRFDKFGPNSPGYLPPPPRAGGKNRFMGPTLNFYRTYLYNGTWYQQSERNLSIYRDSPTCLSNLVNFGAKSWEQLASFWPPRKFLHWETLSVPALPRQANFGTC